MFDLYKALLNERENDSKRLWVLFGLMNVINGILLAFISSNDISHFIPKSVIAFLGIVITIFWFGVSIRMCEWIKWWESKLSDLEESAFKIAEQKNEPIPSGFKLFQGRSKAVNKGLSTKWISYSLPSIFLGAWILLLVKNLNGCICI